MQALILNQNYQAVSVTDATHAFLLVFLEKADLLEIYDNQFLKTVSVHYPMPCIIKLKRYVAMPFRSVMLSRKNILKRDNHRCQYCNSQSGDLTVDHVVPRSRGGIDSWDNLVAACHRCNHRKGNRTPEQAGMTLMTKPFRPNHVIFLQQTATGLHDKWKPYLFMA